MPDSRDYPLVQALGTGNLMHHARPAALPGRVETRCGMEGERTDRDGSFWCPDCLALERAKAGTHGERGGPASMRRNRAAVAAVAAALPTLPPAEAERIALAVLAAALPLHETSHADSLRLAVQERTHFELEAVKLAEQLAAATARAESATVLHERWKALRVERDAANKRAEKAEARLAKLHADIKVTDGVRALARRQRRELDAVIQQHLDALMVENCELRTRVEAPDAAPDGRSEPVGRSETSGGIGTASNSSAGTAGLSEPHAFVVCATCNGSGGYCQRCREGQAGLPHSTHIVTCPDCLGGGTYPPATEDSMAEPTHDEHLTQIRDRSRRLAEIPLETSASNRVMRDMIDSIGDVRWLLEQVERQQTLTAGLRQHWGAQAEHSTSAFPARSREQAQQLAAMNSRIREPGCLPTPYHVVTRLEGDWQRVDTDTTQQPEDGDRG